MHILFITDYLPYPPVSGDLLRVYNLIRRIAAQHPSTLAVLLPTPGNSKGVSHLSEFCVRVETINHQWPDPLTCLPDLLKYLIQGKPVELRLLFSQKLVDVIAELTSQQDFDIVHIEHSRMAFYVEAIQSRNVKTFLTFHNIAFDQFKRISRIEQKPAARLRAWLHSMMMRRWEPGYAERFNRCITVSDADRNLLLAANPRLKIDVIPNGVDTKKYRELESNLDTPSILFIGSMSYPPCGDAAIYFCNQVLPNIQQKIYQVQFWIVGANPLPEVMALANDHVHVTGYVDDVLPYYRQASVCVVPLRAGGGTRLKILEAMALGRPVVSTTIGCEGLEVVDGEHLLIADDPQQFAEKTCQLLTDKALYCHIAENARQLVTRKYDWDMIAQRQLDVYSKALRN
jgi:sugar transferase (PEP-CTERM/EpsH1 system associated)